MQLKAGISNGCGFYIGPCGRGYRAEITVGFELKEQEFNHFAQAVKWIEKIQETERNEIENQRNKEERA